MGALMEQKHPGCGAGGKLNCWQFKKCGREPGGVKAAELGVCPAATDCSFDNIHGGRNAGRACWVVAGSLAPGARTNASRIHDCRRCEFLLAVRAEEEVSLKGFSHSRREMERSIRQFSEMQRAFSALQKIPV